MSLRKEIFQLIFAVETNPSESVESEEVEFKEYSSENALHNAKDLCDEIVALANHKGGLIIIGIRDSNNIKNNDWSSQLVGIPQLDVDTTIERIKGKIAVSLDLEPLMIPYKGKSFLGIKVPKKVDELAATTGGKVFIRVGKSSRPMTSYEITKAVKNLQSYDWSAELLDLPVLDVIDRDSMSNAKRIFAERRKIDNSEMSEKNFLEAIGATQNGQLTKAGLLFLGDRKSIKEHLGTFEYRFSRKLSNGQLLLNDVWEANLWDSIGRANRHFDRCNDAQALHFEGKDYTVTLLDQRAFHEAFMNALVHRDYSLDGMVIVNFTGSQITISSPGEFYGGITEENILSHEPRHRNKVLAKMMMEYNLVDRAGMGVVRMSVNSLKYGRELPRFIQKSNSVEVTMEAEYLRTGIFIITQMSEGDALGITDLTILNSVYETGYINVSGLKRSIAKMYSDPWVEIKKAMNNLKRYVEFCGTKEGIYIRVIPSWNDMLEVKRTLQLTSSSQKHVTLYELLSSHGTLSSSDIKRHLGYSQSSSVSSFLSSATYIQRVGNGRNAEWALAD